MIWFLPYLTAATLVWGPIAPGARAYCPGQVHGKHDDCSDNVCVAPCRVVDIDRETWTVTLVRP